MGNTGPEGAVPSAASGPGEAGPCPARAGADRGRARRILVLAEGFSDDPHHGKTMRGVLRYRPEQVVAVLDSRRAGEMEGGVGKMTVALELDRTARARGLRSEFVPTGQTGIAIAGWGISIDAVVSDFLAGAAERLVVEGHERGGDLLFVEGQGSLVHPAYSGVTLGLLHGSAPHELVLCHLAGTTEVDGYPGHPLPSLAELVALHERTSLPKRRATVACVALNTRLLDEADARDAVAAAEAETGLPTDDPVRFGSDRLLDTLVRRMQ
jgi:uncharacterized NAD-dependent epimerase/dehydratase family protein